MRKESYEFFREIEETPSPSGYEQPVQRIVRRRMEPFADLINTDVHGNVIVALNPDGFPRVMLAGHCDHIGMMIRHVDDNGYLFFVAIGGVDPTVVPGSRVVVHTAHGPVDGVIGRRPIHVLKPEERGAKMELRDMWVDIGARNRKEALEVVRIGDPLTFRLEVVHLANDLVTCPALDNKCGMWVVMEALRLCSVRKVKCALFAVSTVQEEIGVRGARTACYGIDPQAGIAVDVCHATDYPDIDKRAFGDLRIGNGPAIATGPNINPVLGNLLRQAAEDKRIPYQIEAAPAGTGTDANALQISRSGVATALISVPNRYMHTQVEIISLADLDAAARLLAEAVTRIDRRIDFIPQ